MKRSLSHQITQPVSFKVTSYDVYDNLLEDRTNEDFSRLNSIFMYEDTTIDNSKRRCSYYNIPVTFDIETTSFANGKAKVAMMYIWTLTICDKTFYGRTWYDLIHFTYKIKQVFRLDDELRMIVYIRNLAYEFQFVKDWFNFTYIFADSPHKPIYCQTENGFELRCSYKLSGVSLDVTSRNLKKYKVRKLVGDLDYTLQRHWQTELTEKEFNYCIYDTIVDACFIDEEIEKNNNKISKIPLTKTGYVRRYCYERCVKDPKSEPSKYKYIGLMRRLTLTDDDYLQAKQTFQGGFTHANIHHVNEVLHNVASYDFTSSYPYVMVAQYMPITAPKEVEIKSFSQLNHLLKTKCCMFEVTFYNIRQTRFQDTPISLSKCTNIYNEKVNNGRVMSADVLKTNCTELDFETICKFYEWDKAEFTHFKTMYRGRLPKKLVEAIIDLYEMKTILKGVETKEVEYLVSKGMLNSTYGMMVTDIVRDEIVYEDDEWKNKQTKTLSEKITQYNKSRKRFNYYLWGIWVTAHARHNLFSGILECGDDYIYADTDSIKCLNPEKHKDYFESYNAEVFSRLKASAEYYDIPFAKFAPKTITGEVKPIGVWDYEGTYSSFKTLGAKRYIYTDNDKLHVTVAGCPKSDMVSYLSQFEDPYSAFKNNLTIPEEMSTKLLHTYSETPYEIAFTDYQGVTAHCVERSSVNLSKTTFSLNMVEEFMRYIAGIREEVL